MKSGLKCSPLSKVWKTDDIARRSPTHAGAYYQNSMKNSLMTSTGPLEAGTGQDEKTKVTGRPHAVMVKTPWTTWILMMLDVVLKKIGLPLGPSMIPGDAPPLGPTATMPGWTGTDAPEIKLTHGSLLRPDETLLCPKVRPTQSAS